MHVHGIGDVSQGTAEAGNVNGHVRKGARTSGSHFGPMAVFYSSGGQWNALDIAVMLIWESIAALSRAPASAVENAEQEVLLADLDAVLAQDRVGGRGMEIEVRHGAKRGDRPRRASSWSRSGRGEGDVAVNAGLEGRRVDALDEGQHPWRCALQLVEALLSSGCLGLSPPAEAGRRVLGEVAGELNLAREGQHVGRQPRLQQHLGLDLAGRRLLDRLVEDGVEGLECLDEAGQRGGAGVMVMGDPRKRKRARKGPASPI